MGFAPGHFIAFYAFSYALNLWIAFEFGFVGNEEIYGECLRFVKLILSRSYAKYDFHFENFHQKTSKQVKISAA